MKISSIKTNKLIAGKKYDLFSILDEFVPAMKERSILAITSKIVSICEERVAKTGEANKDDLVAEEADLYLPRSMSKYDFSLTIKDNILLPNAGIDESNGNGYYILWPADVQRSANQIREYLKKKFALKHIGVIITDSKTTPLRWGTTGVCAAHSGFSGLNNYIGTPDIFGRELQSTKANVMDALASSAVLVMGEGSEQTPLAMIEDVPFVKFQDRNPSKKELTELQIDIADDLYAPLLKSVKWKKGNGNEHKL
jgi:putative folate metabolism gamma-glutamate ligase